MSDENGSTQDARSTRTRVATRDAVASLHLAFTRDAFVGGEVCALHHGEVLLGRGIPLLPRTPLNDPRISREHARLERSSTAWTIEDLGSHNGTRLNGKPIRRPEPLEGGDVIRLGDTMLVLSEAVPTPLPGEPHLASDLAGVGPGMAQVRHAIQQVAGHGHSVLILGETGTGKEVVARTLHHLSGRPGEFVALNCGSVPEGVLDSELFGHARGAFTGAVSHRDGLFRVADRGTLFLDELGEMPTALQVKLLRALETRRIRPVGGTQEIPVDVRVLAATHRDLVAEVREGRFRADLYARLAQWLIPVPPLRERREDIGSLARHLLARLGAAERRVDVELAEVLLLHDWPLNVRGLFNVLSMATIDSDAGRLRLGAQVERALETDRRLAAVAQLKPAVETALAGRDPPASPRQRGERAPTAEELERLLDARRGNIAEVARLLDCSRQQVYRWIDELGLKLERFRGEATPSG